MTTTAQTYQVTTLAKLPENSPEGMRACRIIFKQTAEEKKNGIEKKESMGCFVPVVTDTFAQSFASLHPRIVAEWIQNLQDTCIRNLYVNSGRSPSENDIGMDALAETFNAIVVSERLTVEQIKAALAGEFGLHFVNYLAKSRGISLENQPENVAMLTQVKQNYLPFFSMATARKPSFETAAIKEKVVSVLCGFGDYLIEKGIESVILEKCLEKMLNAPVATVDLNAL